MTLLEVDGLGVEVKRYGKWVRVIDDVSFAIDEGETLGLVGESGSGKSLTASAVMNLLPPSVRRAAGSVTFEGRVVSTLSQRDFRQLRGPKMAMVFQDPQNSLNPAYTVGNQMVEAIRTHHDMNKREALDRAVELLERVGIKHPRDRLGDYPHQFSGGMAQRVMIALAISSQPRLLIADEPTTALDVTVQAQILRLLQSLRDEFGMSLLLISHDLSVIAEMCDRVAVMYAGQLVETGDTGKVFVVPTHPYTEALLGSHPGPHTKGGVLIAIPGTVPDPSAMPTGCRFHTRCQYATEVCVDAPPPLVDRGGTQVRCARVGEILLDGVRSGTPAVATAGADTVHREPLLVVRDLTKDYAVGGGVFGRAKRTIRAVDDVNIDVQPGESVGLVGESGGQDDRRTPGARVGRPLVGNGAVRRRRQRHVEQERVASTAPRHPGHLSESLRVARSADDGRGFGCRAARHPPVAFGRRAPHPCRGAVGPSGSGRDVSVPVPASALGRPTPTRRDRPSTGAQTETHRV